MKNKHLLTLTLAISLVASHQAHAFLGAIENADGYTRDNVGANPANQAGINGGVGPEVQTYNAGSGTNTFTAITPGSGKFVNNYGAGNTGNFLGGSGDTTYLAGHQTNDLIGANANVSGGVITAGNKAASFGDGVLAFRTDPRPFNDNQIGPRAAQYSYGVDSQDLSGLNPAAVSSHLITISFVTCVSVSQTAANGGQIMSTVDDANFRGLEMSFGGSATSAGARIAWTDENNLAYYDNATNAWIETTKLFDFHGFEQVNVSINTLDDTWSLSINRGTDGYLVDNILTNVALDNTIGSSFGDIVFTANEDLDGGLAGSANANGLAKTFFDNFAITATAVPEPSTALIAAAGLLGLLRRRRN